MLIPKFIHHYISIIINRTQHETSSLPTHLPFTFLYRQTSPLYTRWHKLAGISLKAKVEFEQTDGSWLADGKAAGYISENEFELEKVTAGFDGEDGDAKRPDVYKNKIVKKITKHEPFMTSESDIQYAGGNGNLEVEINESNTVWTYRVYRKTFTVTLNTTDADGTDHEVSSVAETVANTNNKVLKYRYGQKPANNPTVTNTDAYKFKEWQLDSATFKFDGTYELTKNINVNAVFDINVRTATLNVGNVVADNITYPVEDGVTADYTELNTNGTIKLTIRGDKLKPYYELKPLNLTGTVYDKVTHQPLVLDNGDMYSDTKIYDNTTVNVKSKANLDKFKGFYPQDEASSEDSNNVKQHGVKHEFYEDLKENIRFNWTDIYYKGEKYENLGEKVFRYSLVDLEDSPIEPGSKTSTKLLDLIFGSKSTSILMYHDTHMSDYVNKVMRKKMLAREMHIPYLFGKTFLKRGEEVNDNDNYRDLKGYYENRSITAYSQFVSDRKADLRGFSNGVVYADLAVGFIATATQYYFNQMKQGVWTFYPYGTPNNKQGLIWSAHYNDGNALTPLFMQPIINY